jgi:hypothetical protein
MDMIIGVVYMVGGRERFLGDVLVQMGGGN